MKADAVYSEWKDLSDIPESILNRLKHYFLTYKDLPGTPSTCEIADVYGKEEALQVIAISREDYNDSFRK
jgi:inorganic pyrophosphatase